VVREHITASFGHGHRGQDERGGVRTHDQVDLVLRDQLLVEGGHVRLVGLVVERLPDNRPSEKPAVGVESLDELLTRDAMDRTGRGERTRQGEARTDHDRFAARRSGTGFARAGSRRCGRGG
jgi:hypothetical protein